jgi:hypothetical protein
MKQYRAIRHFGYYKSVQIGDIISLDEQEFIRLSHLVESVDNGSNFAEGKPNRKYKGGVKK